MCTIIFGLHPFGFDLLKLTSFLYYITLGKEEKEKLSTELKRLSALAQLPAFSRLEFIFLMAVSCERKAESPTTMLSYTDLKKGTLFIKDGAPHQVLDASFSRMQQRKAVVQAKIKNLATGKITDATLQPSDQFEAAEVEKRTLTFLYRHRGEYVFCDPEKKENRFALSENAMTEHKKWIVPNGEATALFFGEKLITLSLPVKVDLKVIDAPPGIQGDRAQGGTKTITLETGTTIQAPLFINAGDRVRVNTETGEYVERVKKG